MASKRWTWWFLLLGVSVGVWGCRDVRREAYSLELSNKKSAEIRVALRVLGQMRKFHRFTAAEDAEALGLIERFLFSPSDHMRSEARTALVSFGKQGAPLWRRLLRWRQGEASHAYYLRETSEQMRTLGKEIKPLLPDLMPLLYRESSAGYWDTLGILQAGGDISCDALLQDLRKWKRRPPAGGLKSPKAQRRTLRTMARISPLCRAQWREILGKDLALQRQALSVLGMYTSKDSMAYLRLLWEVKEKIVEENRVTWREAIHSVLARARSEASLLQNPEMCRTKKTPKGETFHVWDWEDVQAAMSGLREALRVGEGREALFCDAPAKTQTNTHTANAHVAGAEANAYTLKKIFALVEALVHCGKPAVFDLFLPIFQGYDRCAPSVRDALFSYLQRHSKMHAAWLLKQYKVGKARGRRLAFRLLAEDPKAMGLAVSEMLEVLSGSDEEMALWAMQGLERMGLDAGSAFSAVMRWAEKGGSGNLSSGQRRLVQQALQTLRALGIPSKEALSMCARHWKGLTSAAGSNMYSWPWEIKQACVLAMVWLKKPWEIETVEGWLSLFRSLKEWRGEFLERSHFLREGGEKPEAFWRELYRSAEDTNERRQILVWHRRTLVGKKLTDLSVLWWALREKAPVLQEEALLSLSSTKNQEKELISWLLAFLHPSQKHPVSLRSKGMAALGQVGRKSPEARKALLRWLWKVPVAGQYEILVALQAQKGRGGCEIAQEMLELYGKAHPQSLLILTILAEQSSCMRLAFPMLWRLAKQSDHPHSGIARASLLRCAGLKPRAVFPMVLALPATEQVLWWQWNPPAIYQPSALQEVFAMLDEPDAGLRGMAEAFFFRAQGRSIGGAWDGLSVLFSELEQKNPKRQLYAARLLVEGEALNRWQVWLQQDPNFLQRARSLFAVLPILDAETRGRLFTQMRTLDKKAVLLSLRWLWGHAEPAFRRVGLEGLRHDLIPLDADITHDVVACLKKSRAGTRKAFVAALWSQRLRFPALFPVGKDLLHDKDQGVRFLAGIWMASMGDGAAIPVLREILASGSLQQRRDAVGLFRELKHESASLLPDVRAILTKEEDSSVIVPLLYSLAEWEERAADLRDVLEPFALKGLKKLYPYRHPLVRLLGRIGKKASWAAPLLWSSRVEEQSTDPYYFLEFSEALGRVGRGILSVVLAKLR